MKRVLTGCSIAGLCAALALPGVAGATMKYSVSSTSVENCSGAPHGLWTNDLNLPGGSCANYYDISGTFEIGNAGSPVGHLDATASNPFGTLAAIDIWFGDFAETFANYKQEGGGPYDASSDSPDIDFFQTILDEPGMDSSIVLTESDSTEHVFDTLAIVPSYAFQYGPGANAKDPDELGGSVWFLAGGRNAHWDLNLTFTRVPLPSGLLLMGLGLVVLGLVVARRARANRSM